MTFNDILWGISNGLVFYIAIALPIFAAFYGGFFKWWMRPAGVSIFVDRLAFVGVIALVWIGIFADPQRGFWEAPEDVLWFRPWLRVIVYAAVAFATTFNAIVAFRRWLHTSPIQLEVDPRTRPRNKNK